MPDKKSNIRHPTCGANSLSFRRENEIIESRKIGFDCERI